MPRTASASVRVAAMQALVAQLPLAQDAAEEGKKIVIAMLVVGLIFLSVILLG